MKKIFQFSLIIIMLANTLWNATFSSLAKSTENANERIVSETTEYFEDGSYMTTIITEEIKMNRGATYVKHGYRDVICHDKNGSELWRFTVRGSFTVNPGISATCTDASCSISIKNSSWQNESASAFYTENQAIGDATFIRKLLSITVESKGCHVVLTCDSNGNLS